MYAIGINFQICISISFKGNKALTEFIVDCEFLLFYEFLNIYQDYFLFLIHLE